MNEILEKVLCLALSGGILIHALVVRRMVGTWLFPACLYSLFWFAMTFIPLAALPAIPANPTAILYILATCIVFSLGAAPFAWRAAIDVNSQNRSAAIGLYDTSFLYYAFLFSAGAAIGSQIINTIIQGISLNQLTTNFFETTAIYIDRRYSDRLVDNIFIQFSNIFSYLSAVLGGLLFERSVLRRKRYQFIVISMLPSVFVMLVQGAKGMLFLSISMFYASVLVRNIHNNHLKLANRRAIPNAVLYVLAIIPLVTISFLARGLYNEQNTAVVLESLYRYYASYTSGHLYAFSDWFGYFTGQPSTEFYSETVLPSGYYTFMSIFSFLGYNYYVPPGIYQEYYQYSYYLQSNIFTYYRGLIVDFGITGSLLFMALFGLTAHWSFLKLLTNPFPTISVAAFVTLIGYIYTSFIVSLLIWNSAYAVFGLTWALLATNASIMRHRRKDAAAANVRTEHDGQWANR